MKVIFKELETLVHNFLHEFFIETFAVCVCVLCVCVSVRVCVCVCVCLRPSTVNASSVWSWNSRGQINDVVLKTFLSSAKSLHRYFSIKHRALLTPETGKTLETGKTTT